MFKIRLNHSLLLYAFVQIPFDKINDCDIIEPAGSTCCCIQNTLNVVNIGTGARESRHDLVHTEGNHELVITGLKDPQAFKRMLFAMKRNYGVFFDMPPSVATLDRANFNAPEGSDVASLLREIRDELRQHNAVVQALQAPPAPSASPAKTDIV